MNDALPTSASFLITEDCNLACKYCFELDGRNPNSMSTEVIHQSLEYLCKNAVRQGKGSFHSMVFGGEPLMVPDKMEELFEKGYQLQQEHKQNFSAQIVTNATILNDEIKRVINKYKNKINIGLQLSIDGIKRVHDANRVTRNGEGSFDMIEKNIEGFKELGNNLNIHAVITKESVPVMFESYKFFKEKWGVNDIWFMPLHEEEWSLEDVTTYGEELQKISDYVVNLAEEKQSLEPVNSYAPIDKCLSPKSDRPHAPCGAGKSFISITADGDIYPCHHFYYNNGKELKIGNIKDGIDNSRRRLFLEYDYDDVKCTNNCDHTTCYNCIAVNYDENGSIFNQVRGNYCKLSYLEKGIIENTREELKNMGLLNLQGNDSNTELEQKIQRSELIEDYIENGTLIREFRTPNGETFTIEGNPQNRNNNQSCDCGNEQYSVSESIEILGSGMQAIIKKLEEIDNKIDD